MKKTLAEQIADLEATRAAKVAAQKALLAKASDEGRSTNEQEAQEFDDLQADIAQIDKDLSRCRVVQANDVAEAKAVAATDGGSAAAAQRARNPHIVIQEPKLAKGVGFARLVGSMALAQGQPMQALSYAKSMFPNDAKLHSAMDAMNRYGKNDSLFKAMMVQKAPVDVGTSTDSDFAAPLVNYTVLANEFIEFLRPQTLVGRIPGLRTVPFNIRVARQTGGATSQWVGEAKPKPVGAQAFDYVSLGYTKLAIITAITEELARFSQPNAETLVRDDLARAVVEQMDADFIETSNSGTTNVKPASITNGIAAIGSTGATEAAIRDDVKAMFNAFVTANLDPAGAVFLMHTSTALSLSLIVNALGQPAFPNITMNGGTFFGIPVVTSTSSGFTPDMSPTERIVVLVKANDILIADDGTVTIDTSREASLQMNSTPDDPLTASTVLTSLWQHNLIGIKAERYVNWVRGRTSAVVVLGNVGW